MNGRTCTRAFLPWLLIVAGALACASRERARVSWPALPEFDAAGAPAAPGATGATGGTGHFDAARAAREALLADPENEEAIIWYGRRLAYLGEYGAAIDVYTRGLAIHPDSARLLRHRGHRRISQRDFDAAIADLERAAELVRGEADEVEPDGLPNARGIPTSSLHTNIGYHLGLAHYCRGDFRAALDAYRDCLEAVTHMPTGQPRRDMEVATRYWLHLAARRASGPDAEDWAERALEGVSADWDIIENRAYHRLLLLFRGELSASAVVPRGEDAIQDATTAYGLARYRIMEGDTAAGHAALRELAQTGSPAFGCIAAESDLR